MTNGKAPVEHVGLTETDGPWPSGAEEITEREQYARQVVRDDGTEEEVQATVTAVQSLGDETAYAVSMQYEAEGGA